MPDLIAARATIEGFAATHNLDAEVLPLNDAGTNYLSVDLTGTDDSYVSFDLYENSDTVVCLDSDSAPLQELIQDQLFPLL